MKIRRVSSTVLVGLLLGSFSNATLSSCSSENVFELADPPNDKKKGESALARGDTDAALEYLEDAYKQNPDDPEVRKMLANAYMTKAGVDTLTIIQTIAAEKDGTDWSLLISALPEGNSKNVESLKRSVELMDGIPPDQRTDEERYQLAMAQTSLAIVTAKKYGVDENGNVAEAEAKNISDEDAILIVAQLDGAAANLGSLQDENAAKGAAKIQGVSEKINASTGDTQADKVRTFLQKDKNAPVQTSAPTLGP